MVTSLAMGSGPTTRLTAALLLATGIAAATALVLLRPSQQEENFASVRELADTLERKRVIKCRDHYPLMSQGPIRAVMCFSESLDRRKRGTHLQDRTVHVPTEASVILLEVAEDESEVEQRLAELTAAANDEMMDDDVRIGGTSWVFSESWDVFVSGDGWIVGVFDIETAKRVQDALGGDITAAP